MLQRWQDLCRTFTPEGLVKLLRFAAPSFRPTNNPLDDLVDDDSFGDAVQIGEIELPDAQSLTVVSVRVKRELTARSGKKKQYDAAKRVLKHGNHDAGIFAFYDDTGCFRFSLVTVTYHGTHRRFSTFRRYTFFIDPHLPNKTFLQQMQHSNFSGLQGILETFSIEAVSDEFYKEFKNIHDKLTAGVKGTDDTVLKQDFALLFAIRIIFLGFVQKKGWLGNNTKFLQDYWREYSQSRSNNSFYKDWLEQLFFEAFSAPPGQKTSFGDFFSEETRRALSEAPYLNGELFKRKQHVDDKGLWISDAQIGEFFDFLFQYNFTIEENELYDEELELNPEFLGIIFERITNKDQGAVYTPREEVDLMCRLALVKWLEQTTGIEKTDLYRLFFREYGAEQRYDEYQKQGDFSAVQIRTLIEHLENVTVCDPAAGSGAFEVGMMQVLEQVLENLYSRNNTPEDLKGRVPSPFERRKAIIARSLYGVEVKPWAVWINQLRLWLALFVDMPPEAKSASEPLLPNLTFKVRVGDSLVQRIGTKTFPVKGDANLPHVLREKIGELKQRKTEFFYNENKDQTAIVREELALFASTLDYEIKELQKKINELREYSKEQLSLFKTDFEHVQPDFSERIELQINGLNEEMRAIEVQKRSLKDERPFIWSIEFPEIFFDRGGFDIIIGNPPYLRQEEISDPNGVLETSAYKDALLEMLRIDYPDYFAKSPYERHEFKTGRKPSGRSDLYTYFYVRSLRLLNRTGVHVFICSNSWLDVAYGAWLQEFFLRQAPLYLVIDNHARRSFARADVNTVITVAGAPMGVGRDHIVRFVALKKPFEEVVQSDKLLSIEGATSTLRDESFRVLPVPTRELLSAGCEVVQHRDESQGNSGSLVGLFQEEPPSDQDSPSLYSTSQPRTPTSLLGKYVGEKWGGHYLRAPDIFFTILERGKDKLVRLGDIAEVRFGIKTGANDFFYLEPVCSGSRPGLLRVRNGAGWEGEIEKEFLKPVIKSPQECRSIVIKPEELKYHLFMCHESKKSLKGTRALEYIRWGERVQVEVKQGSKRGTKIKGFHNVSSVRERRIWWDLGNRQPPQGIIPCSFRKVFGVYLNPFKVYTDKRLYEFYGNDHVLLQLNSSLFPLLLELETRSYGGGGGPIDATVEEIKGISVIDEVMFPESVTKKFMHRKTDDIFTECGINPQSEIPISEQDPNPLPDRKALDDIVFDALGLTAEERKEVYRAVCQLVWERISKARSV